MIPLTDLRALLERALTHAENPAIVRLTDRTVEGVARAYLPRSIWFDSAPDLGPDGTHSPHRNVFNDRLVGCFRFHTWMTLPLDLTDPGTAHALLVALALALGLDPGVGGLDCSWSFINGNGWIAATSIRGVAFGPFKRASGTQVQHINAPTVAAEPDPLKALTLAALHVLEHP